MALLALSFVPVLVVVLVLERLSSPNQSLLDGGNDHEKAVGRRSRRSEADARDPAPLIPLRFEDEHDDEDEDDYLI
jgi:hypothetical protein